LTGGALAGGAANEGQVRHQAQDREAIRLTIPQQLLLQAEKVIEQ
jgi:hypothetical protein